MEDPQVNFVSVMILKPDIREQVWEKA